MIKQLGLVVLLACFHYGYGLNVNVYAVNENKLKNEWLYAFHIQGMKYGVDYQFNVRQSNYEFSSPKHYAGSEFVIYFSSQNIEDEPYTIAVNNPEIEGSDIYQGLVPNRHQDTAHIRDYLIEEIALEPLGEVSKPDSGYYTQDFSLKIQISLNGDLYWISPSDKDWGWLYSYVYFNIQAKSLPVQTISNISPATEKYQFHPVENDQTNGKRYRLYMRGLQEIIINASLNTYTYSGRLIPVVSINKQPISYQAEIEYSDIDIQEKSIIDEIYQIPVYLKVDQKCRYSSFINSKLQFEYKLLAGIDFSFSKQHIDNNMFDNKLELFTTSYLYDEEVLIGYLHVNNLLNKPSEVLDLNINFIKQGLLDRQTLNIYAWQVVLPKVNVLIQDSKHDFDIQDLHCHSNDQNFAINIHCKCTEKTF